MKKRILSFMMVLIMVVSMLPAQILATNTEAYNAIVIVQDESGTAIPGATVRATRGDTVYPVQNLGGGRYGFNKDNLTQKALYTITVDIIGYESQPVTMHGTTGSILVTMSAVTEQWRSFTVCGSDGSELLSEIRVNLIALRALWTNTVDGSNWTFAVGDLWESVKACMDAKSIAALQDTGLQSLTTLKKENGKYIAVASASGESAVELYDQNGKFFWAGVADAEAVQAKYASHLGQPIAWNGLKGTYVGADGKAYSITLSKNGKKYSITQPTVTSGTYVVTYTDGVDGEDIFEDQRYAVNARAAIPAFKGEPTRAGYAFSGWVLADGKTPEDVGSVTKNLMFHAVWQIMPKYMATVNVYVDGMYDSAENNAYQGSAVAIETVLGAGTTLYVSKDESTFVQLNQAYAESGEAMIGTYQASLENGAYKIYYAVNDGEKTKISDQILWLENTNHVSYLFFNSITYQIDGVIHKIAYSVDGAQVAILEEKPVKQDNQFIGWQDAEGNLYQPGEKISSKSLVLNAQWIAEGTTWEINFPVKLHSTAASSGITAVNVQILRAPISGGEMTVVDAVEPCVVLTNGEGIAKVEAQMGYCYSLDIVSYVRGDETIAAENYTTVIKVEGVDTPGAYVQNGGQKGTVTATVYLLETSYTVSFDAMRGGTLFGDRNYELTDQYFVPDLSKYIPERSGYTFAGWSGYYGDSDEEIEFLNAGDLLIDDLYLEANWEKGTASTPSTTTTITVEGRIAVDGTYVQANADGSTTTQTINEADRVKTITVLLQQDTTFNGYYETIAQTNVEMKGKVSGYVGSTGTYSFKDLPQGNYRIVALSPNYSALYQNELASVQQPNNFSSYTNQTYQASDLNGNNIATVNARMIFSPPSFPLAYQVDASAIGEACRPETVEVLVTYDDRSPAVTDASKWAVISQMVFGSTLKGDAVKLDSNGFGISSYSVWTSSSDGASLYDYGIRINGLDKVPLEIQYQSPAHLDTIAGGQSQMLKATLVPKTYEIKYELDGGTFSGTYPTEYQWSYETAFNNVVPSRSGYQFMGWKTEDVTSGWDGSKIAANATIADGTDTITLYATWSRVVVNLQVVMDHTGAILYNGNILAELTSRSGSNGNFQVMDGYNETFGPEIWHTNEEVDVVEIPYIYTGLEEDLQYSVNASMDNYYAISSYKFDATNVVTSGWSESVVNPSAYTTEAAYNVVVCLKYDSDMLNLSFSVEMAAGIDSGRWPKNAGVKVTNWNPETSAWEIIEQHINTVMEIPIGQNGIGTGKVSVKRWRRDGTQTATPNYYRIEVISLTLTDGTVISLADSGNKEVYVATGYSATVSVAGGGAPATNALLGAYGNATSQLGTLKAVIEMGSVVFHANNADWERFNGTDVFRTYYPASEQGMVEGASYMTESGSISYFYDIPSFKSEEEEQYETHNKYIFKGWYTAPDESGVAITWPISTTGAQVVNLYAHWIETGTVAKEAEDNKTTLGNTYPGFALMGLQLRFATGDDIPHYGDPDPGMRFLASMSEDVHEELLAISGGSIDAEGNVIYGSFEYGFVIATADQVKAAAEAAGTGYEMKYNGTNVNGEDTTTTHACMQNYYCNGVPDHYNGTTYRLYTLVITYQETGDMKLEDAQEVDFAARAYAKYTDTNGLVRVYHSNYTGTKFYNGVSASYADISIVIPQ